MKTDFLFIKPNELFNYVKTDNSILFIDKNYFDNWKELIPKNSKYIVMETSEERKNLDVIRRLYQMVLELGANRNTKFVGIGGGIVTDMIGYLASTFMRGVNFDFVPTTLLAMVDAAIGGKNGVNFDGYKNMIGTINQPEHVYICPEFLSSLPNEEIYSAFGEILKYGIGFDSELFSVLSSNSIETIINSKIFLTNIILRCIRIKESIVDNDEKETKSNGRRLLNLGHTMAHALEKLYHDTKKYEEFKHHGFAVIFGLLYMTRFIDDPDYKESVNNLLTQYIVEIDFSFPDTLNNIYNQALKYIVNDKKKVDNNKVYFIISQHEGSCEEKLIDIKNL